MSTIVISVEMKDTSDIQKPTVLYTLGAIEESSSFYSLWKAYLELHNSGPHVLQSC